MDRAWRVEHQQHSRTAQGRRRAGNGGPGRCSATTRQRVPEGERAYVRTYVQGGNSVHLMAQRRSTGPGDEGGDLGTERGSPHIEIPKKTIYKNITPENRAPGNNTGGVYEAGQAAGTTTHITCAARSGASGHQRR